ncbi:MAG: hypothetical protein KAK00_09275 [Nanoarchaeota archaeon]|nr:hypothetical protein [Nanoarchaeota archaeon]
MVKRRDLILVLMLFIFSSVLVSADTVTTTLWYPYAEWNFTNPGWPGNAFDVQAQAVFSDGTRPYLFYDENNIWKLRYMCNQTGTFTFTTISSDSDLNGLSGTVICQDNPGAMGLLVPAGSNSQKFYVQGWEKAIVPAWVMSPTISKSDDYDPAGGSLIDTWMRNNIDNSGFLGAHEPGPANGWYDWDCDGTRSACNSENPDPKTFRAYEELMDRLYKNNSFLHLWMFWDCQRDKCDEYHDDTTKQERLRKYLADRWGAIPNWMLGEGFDNHEDDNTTYANKWFNDINDRLAWHHFLGMRSYKNSYNLICTDCNYYSWENQEEAGPMTYSRFSDSYDHSPDRPSFEEDRYRYRAGSIKGPQNVDDQRHYMWWQAMSGGVGAIYGYLDGAGGHYSRKEGYPEDWHITIKAWHDFWYAADTDASHRFMPDMERCGELTDGYGLCKGGSYYVFYKENTASITFDLSALTTEMPAIAMDTKTGDMMSLGNRGQDYSLFSAAYESDWAVAIGNFSGSENNCTPNLINTSWTAWYNTTSCQADDTVQQERNRTQYDSNYCGEIGDIIFIEYRNTESCDYCTPNLVNNSWNNWYNITSCQANDTIRQERNRTLHDSNYCGETEDEIFYEYRKIYCDHNNDGLNGNISDISTNMDNLSFTIENETMCKFKEENDTIIEFDFNFSNGKLNFYNITIEKQSGTSTRGSMRIKGIGLTAQNTTKTIYMDHINGNRICIVDDEDTSIEEISSGCNAGEISLTCNGIESKGYTCTLEGSTYRIEGLQHSALAEYTYAAPSNGGDSPGGGGSSGGGSGIAPKTAGFKKGKISFEGKAGEAVRFMIKGNSNTIRIEEIYADSVRILVKPGFIFDTLSLAQIKSYDLNDDGKKDISARLDSVTETTAKLTISLLSYEPKKIIAPKKSEIEEEAIPRQTGKKIDEISAEPMTVEKDTEEEKLAWWRRNAITGRVIGNVLENKTSYAFIMALVIVELGIGGYWWLYKKKSR